MENGGWRWRMEGGDGEWRVEMANGGWKVESGGCGVEGEGREVVSKLQANRQKGEVTSAWRECLAPGTSASSQKMFQSWCMGE